MIQNRQLGSLPRPVTVPRVGPSPRSKSRIPPLYRTMPGPPPSPLLTEAQVGEETPPPPPPLRKVTGKL